MIMMSFMDGPSVRGEALIYGNPAGCNFISYGHCFLVLTGEQKQFNQLIQIQTLIAH